MTCIRCQNPGAQWVRVHLDVDTYAELCNPCREIWKQRGIATTALEAPEPSVGLSGSRPTGTGTPGGSGAAAAA